MATSKEYIFIYLYDGLVCAFYIDSDTVDGKNPAPPNTLGVLTLALPIQHW